MPAPYYALLIALFISSCGVPVIRDPFYQGPSVAPAVVAAPAPAVAYRIPSAPSATATAPAQAPAVARSSAITSTSVPTAPTTSSRPALQPTAANTTPLSYQSLTHQGISFHLLLFDSAQFHLKVADQLPGTKWPTASAAAADLGGVAAINGGFFNPDGSPLGLVRAQGQSSGTWNASSSLTSGVYQVSSGRPSITRNRNAARTAPELLQTGPFLLEQGRPVAGLSSANPAMRSLLLWDGNRQFALVQTSSCTLAQLAHALQSLPSGIPQQTAINLDGGRSCDFYVSSQVYNKGVQKSHWLRSSVRNYLVLVAN